MRIAHFIQRYPPAHGGSEAYFARLSRYLTQHGDQVTVFTSSAIDLEAFWSRNAHTLQAGQDVEDGVSVRRYGLARWPLRRYTLKALSFFPNRLWQGLTMPCNPICPAMWHDAGRVVDEFDVVHASAFPYAWPILCGRRLARRLRVPFFATPFLHLGDPEDPADPVRRAYSAAPLRWLLGEADGIFVQTESERRHVVSLGIPAERVCLQGLGVDAAECTGGDRRRARTAWKVSETDVVIGHLANQSYEKGTIDLLRAVERMWTAGLPVRVVLAGPQMPNFERFWRSFEERTQPGGRVVRLGVVDEPGKKDFFTGIDVFALPSRSDSFGLVLLEAWANGVPNVGYRAGGIADVICDGVDGMLVRCGDVAGLAEALGRLVRDSALRVRFGSAGRERLAKEFRWEEKLELVRECYRRPRMGV